MSGIVMAYPGRFVTGVPNGPKKTRKIKRKVYSEVRNAPVIPAIQNSGCPCGDDQALQMIRSLLKNPAVRNGSPAKEQPAMRNVQKVTGKFLAQACPCGRCCVRHRALR